MKLSVIITTYNSPAWLQKVMWGYQTQTFKDFEMVIADDGSTGELHSPILLLPARLHLTDIVHLYGRKILLL
ncbi:MAG TPA: glycosyltransferase [Parafilimonas sp.]|nr:glycosyltransferase [Parafilimonas sp.]